MQSIHQVPGTLRSNRPQETLTETIDGTTFDFVIAYNEARVYAFLHNAPNTHSALGCAVVNPLPLDPSVHVITTEVYGYLDQISARLVEIAREHFPDALTASGLSAYIATQRYIAAEEQAEQRARQAAVDAAILASATEDLSNSSSADPDGSDLDNSFDSGTPSPPATAASDAPVMR